MIAVLAIGLATGSVYALIALGVTVVQRATGVINFAAGTYVVVGGLGTYWFYTTFGWPYPLAVAGGVVLAGLWSLAMWVLVVIPLWRRGSAPYIVLLATIIFAALSAPLIEQVITPQAQTMPAWVSGFSVDIGGSQVVGQYVFIIAAAVAAVVALSALVRRSTVGRTLRASSASRGTSQLLGINPELVGGSAMLGAGLLAGLAGAAVIPAQAMQPDLGLQLSVFAFIAAVFGGLESVYGAYIGGLLLGVAQAFVDRYYTPSYDTLIVFGLFTVILLVRPNGLLGGRTAT